MSTHGELAAYLALILAGFLPSEVWRWLGVVFARGLDEDSEIVVWVRAVATAILAGVIAKLTIFAPGVLALSTANDAVIRYRYSLSGDRLQFEAPDGCTIAYAREAP